MQAPISWLKNYVNFNTEIENLMWKLTEIGITTESYQKKEGSIVLDIEVTPNRPDWLSIIGIAHEIAAITKTRVKYPEFEAIPKPIKKLPLKIEVNSDLSPRYTALVISDVKVGDSPMWITNKLKLMGMKPINNLVDITNFVMWELGVPIHVFDYDKFLNKSLTMTLSKGGEEFTSVDQVTYKLPKNSIIIKDDNRVIDLCGIKGGENTGISPQTKNIYIHVPIYKPQLIRRTSQKLDLRSDASYIYERGANAGGTFQTLQRVVDLVLKSAGGKVASPIIDIKSKDFKPWKLNLSLARLQKILGVKISDKEVLAILQSLNLSPSFQQNKIVCIIPTYRGDLKIEEDLIEEVARIYGYNKFPKTLPEGTQKEKDVPYYFDNSFHNKLKNLLAAAGFSEASTLSLVSEETINKSLMNPSTHIRIANPVSLEYQFMRSSLIPSLISAIKINTEEKKLKLFEINKVYLGKPGNTTEPYLLSGITKGTDFLKFKGVLDYLFSRLNIENLKISGISGNFTYWHPTKSAEIRLRNKTIGKFGAINPKVLASHNIYEEIYAFEFYLEVLEPLTTTTIFKPIPKFPPQIEDLTFTVPEKTKIGNFINSLTKIDSNISSVRLIKKYNNSITFRIWYQTPKKTLTGPEVQKIRKKIIVYSEKEYGAILK